MDENQESQRDLLAFLAARVVVLESTLETLLAYLPAIHADILTATRLQPGASSDLAMKLAKNAIGSRARTAQAFYENVKEQFPDLAEVIREHMDLAHKKIDEMYGPDSPD